MTAVVLVVVAIATHARKESVVEHEQAPAEVIEQRLDTIIASPNFRDSRVQGERLPETMPLDLSSMPLDCPANTPKEYIRATGYFSEQE